MIPSNRIHRSMFQAVIRTEDPTLDGLEVKFYCTTAPRILSISNCRWLYSGEACKVLLEAK